MKVSLNRLKKYLDFQVLSNEELIEKIGAQLGAIEEVTQLGEKYQGVVIVKVVSCDKHPNADKLHVCKIDDGGAAKDVERDTDGLVEVVCGAANVRAGLLAVWLPPGTTVPETVGKEPFVLESRDIRGQKSNGMLASPKELALGDSHTGIFEIDGDIKPGTDFAEAFGLTDDAIIDIENKMFTHRPDCFGFLGVARELAGILHKPFIGPDWYTARPNLPALQTEELKLEVTSDLPELVPRFTALVIKNVQIKPSPVWLQVELAKVGQKSINNIVDYTNWFMLETAQPLHAYDYDKVKALSSGDGAKIVVRKAIEGEKITLLSGKTTEPRPETIMIATDKQPIGIGGVMGGANTEVDDNTKNIILECANFDMYSIRRTSMALGLFSDAATRFTKGQSPLQNPAVLLKTAEDIVKISGGQIASPLIDVNHLNEDVLRRSSLHPSVSITPDFINARLGLTLTSDEIAKLLQNVEFKVEFKGEELEISAPFWRTDIELKEDIVEEVGRLHGYDALPLNLPLRSLAPVNKNKLLEAKAKTRQVLSRAGANEVLTYSFVHGDLLAKVGQDKDEAFEVANALRPELQYYRLSLLPSLLDKVSPNIRAGQAMFAIFEIGKGHYLSQLDDGGLPKELERTAFVLAVDNKLNPPGSAYYQAKIYLNYLVPNNLEYRELNQDQLKTPEAAVFEPSRSAAVYTDDGKLELGIIGEFKSSVQKNLKLPRYSAGFELNSEVLAELLAKRSDYKPLPRYPKVTQDISLKLPNSVNYAKIYNLILNNLNELIKEPSLMDLKPVDIYQDKNDQDTKHVTLRLSIASYERTLTDQAVNKLLDEVALVAKDSLGADRL